MSKETKIEGQRPQVLTTPWYKKPAIPWVIILLLFTAFSFTVVGWNLRGNVNDMVSASKVQSR